MDKIFTWVIPIKFTSVTHFNPAVHKVDHEAISYLQQTFSDLQNMIPVKVSGNENCFCNSIICLNGITVLTPSELRGRYLQHKYTVVLLYFFQYEPH